MSHFDKNLDKNNANFIPLTPLSFLERAKDIYPNYEALVYEDKKYTWSQIYKRCIKFASALEKIGITKGDTVSVMACNTPEIFETHYSVPMTGGVLNTINIRLDVKTVGYILKALSDLKGGGKGLILGICVAFIALAFDNLIRTYAEKRKKELGYVGSPTKIDLNSILKIII